MEAERVKQPSRHFKSHGHGIRLSSADLKACRHGLVSVHDVTYGSSRSPGGVKPVASIESWDRCLHAQTFKTAPATLAVGCFRPHTSLPKFKDSILGFRFRAPNRSRHHSPHGQQSPGARAHRIPQPAKATHTIYIRRARSANSGGASPATRHAVAAHMPPPSASPAPMRAPPISSGGGA